MEKKRTNKGMGLREVERKMDRWGESIERKTEQGNGQAKEAALKKLGAL